MRRQLIIGIVLVLGACTQEDASPPATDSAAGTSSQVATEATPDAAPTITEIAPAVEVIAEDVAYGATENHNLNGYIVFPADAIDVPAIILIHEWWGLNDDIKALAGRLAGEGFAVLAIDLFDGATATTSSEAEMLMSRATRDRAGLLGNIRQAHTYLSEFVLAPRIGTLGFGFGGNWSLESAIELGDGIDAVAMLYGQTISDESRLETIDAPVFGIFAENDESIPSREVVQFRGQLRDLGKRAEVLIYPDVMHGFANPSQRAYDQTAAEQAWNETVDFLVQELL